MLNQLGSTLLHYRGKNSEARELFNRAFDLAQKSNDDRAIADTLVHLAQLAAADSEFAQVHDRLEDASTLCRKQGYRAGSARCMSYLADVALMAGEHEQASSCLRTAMQIHEAVNDNYSFVWDRYKRAQVASCRGEYAKARLELEDCLSAFQRMSATWGVAWCLHELGKVALDTEDFPEAGDYFERALVLFRSLGTGTAWPTLHLGMTATYEGRFRSARRSLQKSLTAFREAGIKNGLARALCESARLARLLGEHDQARSFLNESCTIAAEIEAKPIVVAALEQSVYFCKAQEQYVESARLLGKVIALREEMGSAIAPRDRAEYDSAGEVIRGALGEDPYEAFLKAGATSSLEQLRNLANVAGQGAGLAAS